MTTNELDLTMLQDGCLREYVCGPDACGYDGETYCQNCGCGAGELDEAVS